jgi:hypothetical protein
MHPTGSPHVNASNTRYEEQTIRSDRAALADTAAKITGVLGADAFRATRMRSVVAPQRSDMFSQFVREAMNSRDER